MGSPAKAREVIITLDRDDSAILVMLTVRQLNPTVPITTSVREEENANLLRQSGADVAERGIVLEELRLGKGAADRMGKQLYPKIYNGSRYAERLPIGKEEVLRSFRPEALRRFYRDWYRPDLMAQAPTTATPLTTRTAAIRPKIGSDAPRALRRYSRALAADACAAVPS